MPNLETLFLENLTKGKSLLDQGQYEEAIVYLERAYHIKPDDIKVLNMLGTAYFKADRLDKAEEIYDILARKNPNVPVLHSNLGMIRLKKQDWEGAEMAFQRVIELQPDNKRAYGYLGLIYEQQGLLEQALRFYERAEAEGPAERVRARLQALRSTTAVPTEEPIDEADIVTAEPLAARAPEPPPPAVKPTPPPPSEPVASWSGLPPTPPEPAPTDTMTRPLEEVIRALQSQPMPWESSPPPPPRPEAPVPPSPEAIPTSAPPTVPEEATPLPPEPIPTDREQVPTETRPLGPETAIAPPIEATPPISAEPTPTTPSPEPSPLLGQEPTPTTPWPSPEAMAQIPTGYPTHLGIYGREQLYVYPPLGSERFLLLEPHLLEVVLLGRILFRVGSLVGYSGDLRFEVVDIPNGPPVVMAQGSGLMFLAYERRLIHLLSLTEETLCVAMPRFLVAEATLRIQPRVITESDNRTFAYIEISGTGTVGFVIRSKPLILKVLRHMPMVVHSDTVVAWKGTMRVAPVEDPHARAFIRTYSDTAIPLRFEGVGDLVIEQSVLWGDRRLGSSPA
jgi:hypothetical protein